MEKIDYYVILILVGLLLSIPHFFFLKEYKKQHLIIFLILLLATALESYGSFTFTRKINNLPVYNVFFVYLETILILWFFHSFFELRKALTIIKFACLLFIIWGIIYSVFIDNLYTFHTHSFSIGCFMIISACLYFFISTFLNETLMKEKLVDNPLFWITTFIFFFYTTTFLYFSSVNLFTGMDRNLVVILGDLKRTMSIFMYLGMGLAFYLPYLNRPDQKI